MEYYYLELIDFLINRVLRYIDIFDKYSNHGSLYFVHNAIHHQIQLNELLNLNYLIWQNQNEMMN